MNISFGVLDLVTNVTCDVNPIEVNELGNTTPGKEIEIKRQGQDWNT